MQDLSTLSQRQLDICTKAKNVDWSTPEYKLKNFIARSHIHPMHQLRQLMLELNAKTEMIEAFEFDKEQFELEIQLNKEQAEAAEFPAQKLLHELDARRISVKLANVTEKLRTAKAERAKILKIVEDISNSPQGKTKDGRLYVDVLFDPNECEEVEAEYWHYRLAKQAAMDMIAYGRIGVGNMDAIMQLDADEQNKTLAMAYEVLILNERRMNKISDAVNKRIQLNKPVSDIHQLMNVNLSEFVDDMVLSLQDLEKQHVPLIQNR